MIMMIIIHGLKWHCCHQSRSYKRTLRRCQRCNGYRRRTRVQILDESDCISHRTNTIGKGINPIIFTPSMG